MPGLNVYRITVNDLTYDSGRKPRRFPGSSDTYKWLIILTRNKYQKDKK